MTEDFFFDTDCLSAFLWVNETNILHELYGGRIIIPEPVYRELDVPNIPHLKKRVDGMIQNKDAMVHIMNVGTEEYELYASLVRGKKGKKAIGRGEAAGITLAKLHNGILASNNHKDIDGYIREFHLRHIDTGQILMEALDKGLVTEENGNDIWKKMLDKMECCGLA